MSEHKCDEDCTTVCEFVHRAALTESRREVEELKVLRLCQNCKKVEPSNRAGACASCWFTRYERLKNASEQEVKREREYSTETHARFQAQDDQITSLRRQVEEQAGKLADASTLIRQLQDEKVWNKAQVERLGREP